MMGILGMGLRLLRWFHQFFEIHYIGILVSIDFLWELFGGFNIVIELIVIILRFIWVIGFLALSFSNFLLVFWNDKIIVIQKIHHMVLRPRMLLFGILYLHYIISFVSDDRGRFDFRSRVGNFVFIAC